MLVPLSFGPFTGTVTDSQGNVVDTVSEPGDDKGASAKNAKDAVSCTFSLTDTQDGYTFTGGGSVVVRITPARS